MSQENVRAIRLGFEHWNTAANDPDDGKRRDAMEKMAEPYHPDAVVDFSRTLPDYSPTRGSGSMIAWMTAAREAFTAVRIEPTEFIDTDKGIVVRVRVTATGSTSEAITELEFAYVFEFREGLVVSAISYRTVEEAREAVGLAV